MALDDFSFSEGADGGSEGGAEATSEAVERFKEQQRKSAAQAKRDKKQEGKRKQQDNTLARIIVHFLGDKRYTGFFVLISSLLDKNIPSDFLLAILALIHKDSADVLKEKEIVLKRPPNDPSKNFPPKLAKPLSYWTSLMYSVAGAEPHKVLETIVDHNWDLDPNLSQFMSLVLKEFFKFMKFEVPFENLKSFSEVFLKMLFDELEKQVQNQQKIS